MVSRGGVVAVLSGLLVACGGRVSDDELGSLLGDALGADTTVPQTSDGSKELFAEYKATVREDGTLSVSPLQEGGGLKPLGFIQLTGDSSLDMANLHSCIGADKACTGADGGVCQPGEICVDVRLTNNVSLPVKRTIEEVWVEVFSMNPSDGTYRSTNSDQPVEETYPESIVSDTYGRWRYGDLQSGQAVSRFWKFDYKNRGAFSFLIRAWGTYNRSWYNFVPVESDLKKPQKKQRVIDEAAFIDACEGPSTRVLAEEDCDDCRVEGKAPFPMTVYGYTSDKFVLQSRGVMTLGDDETAGRSHKNVPASLASALAPKHSIFPLWAPMTTTKGNGVCYRVQGTAPHRELQVTWKNAVFAKGPADEGVPTTFTTVIHEGTDDVDFLYASDVFSAPSEEACGVSRLGVIGIKGEKRQKTELRLSRWEAEALESLLPGRAYRLRLQAGERNRTDGPQAPPIGNEGRTN